MRCVRAVEIVKVIDNKKYKMEDNIVVEYELLLSVNGHELIKFICTPENMEELAMGYLYSENIIKDYDCIKHIQLEEIDENKGKINVDLHNDGQFIYMEKGLHCVKTITTSCGNNKTYYLPMIDNYNILTINSKIDCDKIIEIMKTFNKKSKLFINTGGVHSCAITDSEDILYFAEDIGRHNALDKVVGMMIKEKADLSDKILLTSGRISSEIVFKALSAKVSVLVSRSAPTSKALMVGEKYNMTIIGFARGNRLNVYTGLDRGGINESVR